MHMVEGLKKMMSDESGVALVLALVLMLLMGVLGTVLYSTTSTEMQISRNYFWRQDAFYAAERGIEYAQTDSNIYNTVGTGSVNIPLSGVSLQVGSSDASGTVQFLASGNPPRGSGVDITKFKGNYYLINVTGTGTGNSSVSIETNVVRIVPKP